MRRHASIIAAVLAVALLAAPALGLAQSAGGDQYGDPLAGGSTTRAASTSTTKTGPSATKAPPVSLTTTSSSGATTTSSSGASSSSGSSSSSSNLPRTGLDERLLVAIAVALVLCGVGLRLRTAGGRR